MGKIYKILIICTGNSCRSPMAEGFLKSYLSPEDGYEIRSAGISAIDGAHSTAEAIEVMLQEKINISSSRSKPLTKELAREADIILAMAQAHKLFITQNMPEFKEKVFLYKEFAGINQESQDIQDPIGAPLDLYRKVKEEIKRATLLIIERIKKANH